MEGQHRLDRTDRSLLWGTAALIAFTLGAITVARMDRGGGTVTDATQLCYNSAGVGSACLPPPPPFDVPSVTSSSPVVASSPSVEVPPPVPTQKPTTSSPSVRPSSLAKSPTTKPSNRVDATVPEWRAGVAYARAAKVSYRGDVYSCVQPHTSQSDWSPPATPALWSLVSGS